MRTWVAAISLVAGLGTPAAAHDDALLRPIAPDYAKQWLGPQPPAHIFGNAYQVGFEGLSVGLIRTSAGLILIDGAVPQAVPAVEANLRKLGFDIRQVKLILSTEPHWDHAGGLAALARDSGATVLAGAAAAPALRAGGVDPTDPQAGTLERYPGVPRVRGMRDGEAIRLGDTVVTAVATPGHTQGSTSWTWRTCAARRCVQAVFAASLNPISADGYRFTDPAHAWVVPAFRQSFARVRGLKCDLLFSAHPSQSDGDAKFLRWQRRPLPNPFLEPGACSRFVDSFEAKLDARLKAEGKQ